MSRWVELILRVLLAAVFLLSGLLKIENPSRFLTDILSFDLFPYGAAYFMSLFLPIFELVVGLAILMKKLYSGALLLFLFFMGATVPFLAVLQRLGKDYTCGCFGEWVIFPSVGWHISFNLFLVAIAAVLWVRLQLKSKSSLHPIG